MVKYFHFHANNVILDAQLHSVQCIFIKDNGLQCKKRCQIGISVCWIHLLSEYKLRIKDSPGLGKGLFADNNLGIENNDIVFKVNDIICEYEGEVLTEAEVINRYGNLNGPYVMKTSPHMYKDCALHRCVAGLINHKGHSTANSKFISNQGNVIKIRAKKIIRNGQEIKADYGYNNFHNNTSTNSRKRHV